MSRVLLSKWPALIGWLLYVIGIVVIAWAVVQLSA